MKKAIFGMVLLLVMSAGALAQPSPCAMPPASAKEQTFAEAAKVCRVSAEQGDAKAQSNLAFMYSHGQGVPRDDAEAVRWYRKAADQGYAMAQNGLAIMYYQGRGVPQDDDEAVRWFRKAADQGYAKAQYGLGFMYDNGRGVLQDHAEAVRWFRKAADQGDEFAQRALGLKGPGLSTWNKISLSAMFLWCLLFFMDFLLHGRSLRNGQQRALTLATLFALTYVGLSLYGAFGLFQSLLAVDAFYFVKHLVAGVLIAMLISVIWPKSAKIVLGVSGVLFVGINILLLVIALHDSRRFPAGIRGCYAANGFLLGMGVSLAVFLWLRPRKPAEILPTEVSQRYIAKYLSIPKQNRKH